jgi:ABC-type polysaccharide/polyol phosphate export permease
MLNSIKAFADFKTGILQFQLWWYLGHTEIKQKYRRSSLGPWWITISMIVFISAMGVVFSKIFNQPLKDYIPNFTAGFLFWTFFATSVTESAEIFKNNAGFIKQTDLPLSMYVLKHISKQIICLAHNFVVYFLAAFIFKLFPNPNTLFFLPGIFLFLANLFWICFLISMICARFRDMIPILNSCIQIAFFITPISWSAKSLSADSKILLLNPLVYLIDIVKSPLLGISPSFQSWCATLLMLFLGSLITFFVYSSKRSRIPFWIN